MTNTMKTRFYNADSAFSYFLNEIRCNGVEFGDTKALFNVGFTIEHPTDMIILNGERSWNREYANAEWQWYLSGDRNISKLGDLYGKVPPIWTRMADKDGNVNSNYGWQWKRNKQLDNVIAMLESNPDTRQAAISIYDAKEINDGHYQNDTPCTYAVQFTILNNKLNMAVVMRSNDLWFGFCNDQYCFASLQMLVAYELGIQCGEYYHYAHNLHLYNNKL
jgi:thymidylate synthase